MSAENKVPAIRFKGFSGEWISTELGKLLDITSAARVHKEEWEKDGVPFFRTSDVVSIYKGLENKKAYISFDLYKELSAKSGCVEKDDLLITGGGSIGIPYLIASNEPLYFKDGDLIWLKNAKGVNGYFLFTFFSSQPCKRHISSITHIGTISHYTIEQAKATPINISQVEEQTKIGNYFQQLDALIAQHQQKHDKLLNLKKALLEKMFPKQGASVPEVRFKGFSWDWNEKALHQIVDVRSGRDYKHLSIGDIPVFGTGGYMLSVNEALSYDEDAIGIGRKGTIDKPYILKAPFWTVDTLFYALPYAKNNLDFVYAIFQKINWRQKDESTGVPSLSKVAINNISVFATDETEQTKIGNFFKNLDTLLNQHQSQLKKLNNIKQACLEKMFV
ncbi:MAG: restriction endonuclease subunit S [Undibacterium sp.]|uniref:restriction endonuclease subunit S n=1 Tax=Undibacterium sp. TaxID=1914977 RepID=UPI002725C111|nr:restriction endonuclease subunit S [Undibacterium sp.]MDO8653303.1 restriction endonuclease subunit S [Undibacterium sp.]